MQKVLIGNSITSIKEISRINFLMLFEEINGVEEILKKAQQMFILKWIIRTKAYYREAIKKLANKTKFLKIILQIKLLELARENLEGKKSHIGYYLIDEGYNELIKRLNANPKLMHKTDKAKAATYGSNLYINHNIYNNLWIMHP